MLHESYFCFETWKVEFYAWTSIVRSRNNIRKSGGRDDRENIRILGICGTPGANVGSAFCGLLRVHINEISGIRRPQLTSGLFV